MIQFRKLKESEIEVRVGQVSKDGVGWATLLLYKDARVDMDILDETVGAENWQRHHGRDNRNCIVSIWDSDKGQWIDKEDTGTESNTEKEKGLASDSFKRACVNWGIGRELYSSPKIFIKCEVENKKIKGNPSFKVTDIDYDENGDISVLAISDNKGNGVFIYSRKQKRPATLSLERAKEREIPPPKGNQLTVSQLKRYGCKEAEKMAAWLSKQYGVSELSELSAEETEEARDFVKKRANKE